MRSLAVVMFALTMVVPALGIAQSNTGQAIDATFAAHVKEWTTKPEFVSPLVDHLPAATTVPTPRDVVGHDIGAPNKLDYYEDLLKYYRALADKSPRVEIIETGKTDWYYRNKIDDTTTWIRCQAPQNANLDPILFSELQ
jgi:hypothetical protein